MRFGEITRLIIRHNLQEKGHMFHRVQDLATILHRFDQCD